MHRPYWARCAGPGPGHGPFVTRLLRRHRGRARRSPGAPERAHPSRSPGLLQIHPTCRPRRPGSPSPRPRDSSGGSGTAARRSSSARSAPRCGPTPSPTPRCSMASPPTNGPTRAGARCWPPGRTAWPTAASSSTGCGPRRPWTSPNATTPSTAWCAGCPGRSRPGTRTRSRSACSCTPHRGIPSRCCSSWSTTWAARA